MLRALASREPNGLTKSQVATLAGLSPSSGTFSTYLSKLRTLGFIYENPATSEITITPTGSGALGERVSQPSSTEELVAQWKTKFSGKVGEMLQELVGVFPASRSKEELGEIVGITPTSGTFSTYLSKLRSNGLVTVDRSTGQLKASEDLFL
jgi:DNA-binding PadR family transcriptional regulator